MAVSIDDLTQGTIALLRRAIETNEPIDIVERGAVVARLVPVPRPRMTPDELDAWRRERDGIAEEIGRSWPEGVSAVDAIREGRREL